MKPSIDAQIQAVKAAGICKGDGPLAEKLGVTRQQVSTWKSGKVTPHATTRDKLFELYLQAMDALSLGDGEAIRQRIEARRRELLAAFSLAPASMIESLHDELMPKLTRAAANRFDDEPAPDAAKAQAEAAAIEAEADAESGHGETPTQKAPRRRPAGG